MCAIPLARPSFAPSSSVGVAKLDEHGTTATRTKKDQAAKADKATRPFKKVIDEFKAKLWDIEHGH